MYPHCTCQCDTNVSLLYNCFDGLAEELSLCFHFRPFLCYYFSHTFCHDVTTSRPSSTCYKWYSNTHLTCRLILLHLKYTLLTYWRVVIHILHDNLNLHGWIHLVVMLILCQHHQDVLKQNQQNLIFTLLKTVFITTLKKGLFPLLLTWPFSSLSSSSVSWISPSTVIWKGNFSSRSFWTNL